MTAPVISSRIGFRLAAVLLLPLAAGCITPRIRYEESSAPHAATAVREGEERGRFLLYTGDLTVPGDLESAARLYRRVDGAEVLLIAMVHFADRSFYDSVARRIGGADVVLLEGSANAMIAGSAAGDESATGDAAEIFEALDLVPQPDSERLGPRGPRYVRGDVEKDDLAARVDAVRRSGATWAPNEFPRGTFAWDRFWYAVVGRTTKFRRTWRHAFATRLRPIDDKAIQEILIDPRNERVLAKLDEELLRRGQRAAGGRLRIAIPWGSEHMPGIERGLLARQFAPISCERVVAWRVRSYE